MALDDATPAPSLWREMIEACAERNVDRWMQAATLFQAESPDEQLFTITAAIAMATAGLLTLQEEIGAPSVGVVLDQLATVVDPVIKMMRMALG